MRCGDGGMQVRWETLREIAASKIADVWYLFPLTVASDSAHATGPVSVTFFGQCPSPRLASAPYAAR